MSQIPNDCVREPKDWYRGMIENQEMTLSHLSFCCAEVEEQLEQYLDEEMSSVELNAFESHVAGCSDCQSLLEDCRLLAETAKLLADVPIPAGVSQRLRQVLREELGHCPSGDSIVALPANPDADFESGAPKAGKISRSRLTVVK